MRIVTIVALLALLAVLGGAIVLGLSAGGGSATIEERWITDSSSDIRANHHAPAAGVIDGTPMLFAPISGEGGSSQCTLAGIRADTGERVWTHPIPPERCTLHAVADPTLHDIDEDGTREVLAATTEELVVGHEPLSGERIFRHELTDYGYTRPVVGNLTGDERAEIVVVDVTGTVFVLGPDGEERWRDSHDSYTWGQPDVADFDGDGGNELVVALGTGQVVAYEGEGAVAWNRSPVGDEDITWMTTVPAGPVDAGGRNGTRVGDESEATNAPAADTRGDNIDVVVATVGGTVARVDGATGDAIWRHDLGEYAAVHAVGDGDGDGQREVYATARDGVLRSLAVEDGATEWSTKLTTANVEMMPPPSLGDVDGDGDPELVAPGNDGVVSIVDPSSGEVLGSYERSVPIYTHATLADTDGDGAVEPYVIYGDGRVVALSVSG